MHKQSSHVSFSFRMCSLFVFALILVLLLVWGVAHSNLLSALFAGVMLAIVVAWSTAQLISPVDKRLQATERTLRVASATLVHMADGLSEQGCMAVCQLLLSETAASAIAMTDTRTTLAYVGSEAGIVPVATKISTAVKNVLDSKRVQTFTLGDQDEWKDEFSFSSPQSSKLVPFPAGIIAPLIVSDKSVGTLKLYYARKQDITHTQITIVCGLAELLSTQLLAYELDRQAELTARAEVKALQAQINPHFLFNTLNTIASFTRTNPEKARLLLRDFSSFYRHTLESSQTLIPLSEELQQTRRYLQIEKARFGENRIIENERIAPNCADILVPGFMVQPIVENAVRHAMKDDEPLHIDVLAVVDDCDVLISVCDDGLGMDPETADRLLQSTKTSIAHDPRGTGIALRNVAERIERFYGAGSGVEIVSKLGEGTCVTLRLSREARPSCV